MRDMSVRSFIICFFIIILASIFAAVFYPLGKTSPTQIEDEPIIISVTCKHGITYTRRFDKPNIIGFVGDGYCVVAVKYEIVP